MLMMTLAGGRQCLPLARVINNKNASLMELQVADHLSTDVAPSLDKVPRKVAPILCTERKTRAREHPCCGASWTYR
jgi:hypothetical protein